jgi:hypothetical protein
MTTRSGSRRRALSAPCLTVALVWGLVAAPARAQGVIAIEPSVVAVRSPMAAVQGIGSGFGSLVQTFSPNDFIPINTPVSTLNSFVTDAVGNVYCSSTLNLIVKLDSNLIQTLFTIPTPNAQPGSLAFTPDYTKLYFTEAGKKIGALDVATGAITDTSYLFTLAGLGPIAVSTDPASGTSVWGEEHDAAHTKSMFYRISGTNLYQYDFGAVRVRGVVWSPSTLTLFASDPASNALWAMQPTTQPATLNVTKYVFGETPLPSTWGEFALLVEKVAMSHNSGVDLITPNADGTFHFDAYRWQNLMPQGVAWGPDGNVYATSGNNIARLVLPPGGASASATVWGPNPLYRSFGQIGTVGAVGRRPSRVGARTRGENPDFLGTPHNTSTPTSPGGGGGCPTVTIAFQGTDAAGTTSYLDEGIISPAPGCAPVDQSNLVPIGRQVPRAPTATPTS